MAPSTRSRRRSPEETAERADSVLRSLEEPHSEQALHSAWPKIMTLIDDLVGRAHRVRPRHALLLGAALAGQEGEVAFDALPSTHPNLSLVPGRPPQRQVVPGALRLTEPPVRL